MEDANLWSFQTDPDFQKELDWIGDFIKTEVEPGSCAR
jgi:acyl-CoA dehydrogenase